MVKIAQLFVSVFLSVIGSRHVFGFTLTYIQSRNFVRQFMSDSDEAGVSAPSAPAGVSSPSAPAGALVPVNQETVEFTAGVLGAAAGLVVGGPVLAAVGAAAANYASKSDKEIGDVTTAVSKSSLQIFNYLSKLDKKYSLLNNAKSSLEKALASAKEGSANAETIEKVETALASTNAKIKEINDEYDLVGAGMTSLGVIGELVEKAIKKGAELNEEYKLSEKALSALKSAVDSASTKAKEAAASQ